MNVDLTQNEAEDILEALGDAVAVGVITKDRFSELVRKFNAVFEGIGQIHLANLIKYELLKDD